MVLITSIMMVHSLSTIVYMTSQDPNCKITYFDMGHNVLGDEGGKAIVEAIKASG
jgi:hypothetical protein